MCLIDKTYFRNKLELTGLYTGNTGIETKLNEYISIYVVDFLQRLLGVDFEDLNTNVINGVLDAGAPQRWLDLVNGKTYVKDSKTFIWKGLLRQNGSVKLSVLANVVYCKIMADLHANNGKIVVDTKSATMKVPRQNYIEAWNEIAEQFNCLEYHPKVSIIDGVVFTDYYNSNDNTYVSLMEFMNEYSDDYPNANFNLGYNIINSFDI